MTAQEILALAQQGNPTAIATLLNLILEPRGIKARAQWHQDRLHILLESNLPPIQSEAVAFIRNSLDDLPVQGVKTVTVYGRQRGEVRPGWSQTIGLSVPDAESLKSGEPKPGEPKSGEPTPVNQDSMATTLASMDESSMPESSTPESAATQLPGAIGSLHPDDFSTPKTDLIAGDMSDAAIDMEHLPPGLIDPFSVSEKTLLPLGDSEASKVLKRPEAVVFIMCVTLVIFWDTYTALLGEEEEITAHTALSTTRTALSTSQLARRLNISKSVLRQRKRLPDFKEWSRSLDPNGIAWEYHGGRYIAQFTA